MINDFFNKTSTLLKILREIIVTLGRIIISLSLLSYELSKIIFLSNRKRIREYLKKAGQVSNYLGNELKKERHSEKLEKLIKYFHRKKDKKGVWVPKFAEASKGKVKKRRFYGLKMFLFGLLFALIVIVFPVVVYLWFKELPNPGLLVTKEVPVPSRIVDRKGRLMYEVFIDKRYEPVNLEKVPKHVIQATLAVEDDDFYEHIGFDVTSTVRAAKKTLLDDDLQGGSTITQQLIKNVLLTPERTIQRKLKEIVLAVLVEARYSKDQILELYLNNISYGGNAWGIQSASEKFFGKNVWELDLAEASLLAGLPSAPTTYSPLGGDDTVAKGRQKYVLNRMYSLNYISKDQVEYALGKELIFAPQTEYIRAPHFITYVRNELERIYGRRYLETGGLLIQTTLDLDIQDRVQQIVKEEVEKNRDLNITNGAAVILDPKTGDILAYVGSVDYFYESWGAYDVVTAFRQPGSSIKPITYALALENGFTPASIISDTPVTFNIKGQPPYTPKNYDGRYHGNITLRSALANSYNVPAVKVADRLGAEKIVAKGIDLGLSNWKIDGDYGISVTLGGEEVRLLDLTNVYATFAREGMYKEPKPFMSISDRNGFQVYENSNSGVRKLSKEISYIIWHILSDNNARIPAFGSRNSLVIPGQTVAVKTGTTDQIKDNFTFGFTPSYVVGVWVGNNDNTPLNRRLASGISGAAPIWNRIMTFILEGTDTELLEKPDGVFVKVDSACNKTEVFIKGSNVPDHLCVIEKDEDKENVDDDEDNEEDEKKISNNNGRNNKNSKKKKKN